MAALLARNVLKKAGCIRSVLGNQLTSTQCVCPIQVATLRATYGEPFGYKEPYPYWEKKLTFIGEWFDLAKKRLNENSKIILVDGNVAVGKNDFGERLAKAFDLRHYPSVSPERVYVDLERNFDLRKLNELMPRSCRFYDLEDFYTQRDPWMKGEIGKMQIRWYMKKYENYTTACLHMLSTGQGVVITSSAFNDGVYIDAMKKMGYITPNFHNWATDFFEDSIIELMPPHLCIYLNAPLEVIRERINKRNAYGEVGSKILTDEYLNTIEDLYRKKFFPRMEKTSEVLHVDWTEVGDDLDVDAIAEEIEGLTLHSTDRESDKFAKWKQYVEDDYARFRRIYSRRDTALYWLNRTMPTDCPEIKCSDDDIGPWINNYYEHPALMREPGYDFKDMERDIPY